MGDFMKLRFLSCAAALLFAFLSVSIGAEWPPTLEKSEVFNNRVTDRYQHGSLPAWGAKDPAQTDEFAVLHPAVPELVNADDRPLYVILHSAGHSLDGTLGCQLEKGNHDIYDSPDDFYALILDCKANDATDWWWGGLRADEEVNDNNRDKSGGDLSPCEKRVIDTILWTMAHYKIDPNRVYLCGNSMGGSGTLGIGIRHGNIFAAIKANVPAGCRHAAERMYLPPREIPEGVKLPDPPICIDYSGSNDKWSYDHAVLVDGMRLRKYPLMAFWGPHGHENNHEKIEKINDLPNRFDWTEVRKNEAYPVFTYASSDSSSPWPDPVDDYPARAPAGQINGFFRWSVKCDTSASLSMTLRVAGAEELHSKIFTIPTESTADVSFRRLQKFQVKPGEVIGWSFGTLSGKVKADADGLITIPRLPISVNPQDVVLTKNPVWPGDTVDAADFGFDSEAEPDVNAAALQKALDGGNKTVTITKPGTYRLGKTVLIDSGTRLTAADGVVLKKDGSYVHVLLNRGAETGEWNENIELDNIQIATSGISNGWQPGDLLFGLRGQVAFFRVRNLYLSNFKCLDVCGGQYALHICAFDNVTVNGYEIRGDKDGIHIGAGRGIYMAHGICQTFDDALAFNAEDYPSGQPVQGDIVDGLIEDLTDEWLDPTVAHAVRLLTGAWVDWHPGIKFQNGDTVSHNGNVYRIVATHDTTEYVSNNPPTHEKGAWTDPDVPQLTFVWNGRSAGHSANIKNLTFKDIRSLSRCGYGIYWETGEYHRAVHPEVAEAELPVCQVAIEGELNESVRRRPLMNVSSNLDMHLLGISTNGPVATIDSPYPIKVNIDLRGSVFKADGRENVPDFTIGAGVKGKLTLAGHYCERPVDIQISEDADFEIEGTLK